FVHALSYQARPDHTSHSELLFILELPCNHLDRARCIGKLVGVIYTLSARFFFSIWADLQAESTESNPGSTFPYGITQAGHYRCQHYSQEQFRFQPTSTKFQTTVYAG